jgi:hypothetical protein
VKVLTLVLLLLLQGQLLCLPPVVRADETLIFSDNFDSPDFLAWQEVQNTQFDRPELPCEDPEGTPLHWQVQNQQAYLNLDFSPPCQIRVIPTDLTVDSNQAYKFGFTTTITNPAMDRNWLIRWQDENNYLAVHIYGPIIVPEKKVNGKSYGFTPEMEYFNFRSGQTYQVEVTHQPTLGLTTIQILGEEKLITFSEKTGEPKVVSGIPGLAGSIGYGTLYSQSWYDNFQIWSIPSPENIVLPVPHILQTDTAWKNAVYDSANHWAGSQSPGIGRWGCALTSAVMILRYYGFHNFPEGQPIQPDTLNIWLNEQIDGYFDQGNLNWRAISRLTHELRGTTLPTLEFAYTNVAQSDQVTWLKTKLFQAQPIILAEPGHFIVAHGIQTTDSPILIRDPVGSYSTLQPYSNRFLSARVFTPSHTNLQAITVAVKPGTQIAMNDIAAIPLLEPQAVEGEYLWIYDWPKPGAGTYTITVTTAKSHRVPVTIFAYTPNGQVTKWESAVQTGAEIEINVLPDQPVQVQTTAPIYIPLTKLELLDWLLEEQLHSPFLLDLLLEQQTQLDQAVDLTIANNLLESHLQQLESWKNNEWIEPDLTQLLQDHFRRQVQNRFP